MMKKLRIIFSVAALVLAVVFVVWTSDLNTLALSASRVPASAFVLVFVVMTLGYLLASIRVQTFAAYAGHNLTFRGAVAAVSSGQIAGNFFFQIVGQTIARGALLSRAGIPVATTVVITGYERLLALLVSVVMAAVGAVYIFGTISIDSQSGGYDLAKLFMGAVLAMGGAAWLGWGKRALATMPPFKPHYVGRILIGLLMSAAIQLSTMAAYIVVAHALAPSIPLLLLAAAASVVMLAASLPISLAGWGIREVSAVFALGAVGLSPSESLISAVTIGLLSLFVAGVLALLSINAWKSNISSSTSASASGIDYSGALKTWLPIAGAVAIAFQIYLPTGSGQINVNFADPIAILGGALFVIWHIRSRAFPQWRLPNVNLFLACFSLMTLFALLNGYAQIGWTSWALTSKAVGWLILMAYFFVGASIVDADPKEGFFVLLGTYAGSVTAIAALDLTLMVLRNVGVAVPEAMLPFRIAGFAQNANAFAFQLLLALAAILVLRMDRVKKCAVAAILFSAIWFSGSRAGFGSMLVLLAVTPLTIWGLQLAALKRFAVVAVLVVVMTVALLLITASNESSVFYSLLYNQDSDRFSSILGGISLFRANPLLGAGLGVYVHDHMAKTGDFLPIHSSAVWLLAEYGIVGFSMVFGAAVYVAWMCFKGAMRGNQADRFVILVLTIFATMSLVHEMLYQRTLWMLLGVALAARTLSRNESTERPDVGPAIR